MIFKRLNRTAAEQIFAVFQANASGIAADDVVSLETTAASVDGVKVIQPGTALAAAHAVVGIADSAIGNGSYGLVQIFGYRSTSRIILTDSTQSALAQALKAVSAQDYLSTVASTVGVVPFAVLLESLAIGTTTASAKIFLRMM